MKNLTLDDYYQHNLYICVPCQKGLYDTYRTKVNCTGCGKSIFYKLKETSLKVRKKKKVCMDCFNQLQEYEWKVKSK